MEIHVIEPTCPSDFELSVKNWYERGILDGDGGEKVVEKKSEQLRIYQILKGFVKENCGLSQGGKSKEPITEWKHIRSESCKSILVLYKGANVRRTSSI
ncbi:hypothetical protein AVEN_109068-1 [Araneus ventricosus]|uniref:Uncharacterized protein n=1 Tax=Araneus ventricosus TaxID=182803 RepID=A0A4Y1ZPP0_ARAVE|nr:hypothetical protein AVEN_109068-1 [Araneus ventricosus]